MNTSLVLDRENFEAWYGAILERLYPTREAGFVIATIAFPLLEMYVRQKIQLPATEKLNDGFHKEVMRLIPDLQDVTQARQFWSAFRNGLLHQVTLQLETQAGVPLPNTALTHDIAAIFQIDQQTGAFVLHPVLFAQRVLELIRNDFSTFVGQVRIGPPLPIVRPMTIYGAHPIGHIATVTTSPLPILGTSTQRYP